MGRKARASRATGRRSDEPQISSQARQGQAAQDGGRLLELVLAGQHGAVEAILSRRVDPNFADANGWTAFFHASQRGQLAMVKTLLKKKANARLFLQIYWCKSLPTFPRRTNTNGLLTFCLVGGPMQCTSMCILYFSLRPIMPHNKTLQKCGLTCSSAISFTRPGSERKTTPCT